MLSERDYRPHLDPCPTSPGNPMRPKEYADEPCNMAMRENAQHLLVRRTKELRQKAEYLDTLRRYLPAEMPTDLEQAVYEIISELRR